MSRIKWKQFIADLLDNPQLIGRDREYVEHYQALYLKKKTLSQGKKNHLSQIKHRMDQLLTSNEAQEKLKPLLDALNHPQAEDLLTDWDRRFLGSVYGAISKGYEPTSRQKETLNNVMRKVDPDEIAVRQRAISQVLQWIKEDELYARNVKVVAEYYREHCPIYDYGFSHAVDIALYRPHEFNGFHMDKINRKMNDKWARQVIANVDSVPKYDLNQHVTINSQGQNHRLTGLSYSEWSLLGEDGGFVVGRKQKTPQAVKGGAYYTILLIGGAVVHVQERFLKKFPKTKRG
jgi:hypothetical protein